MRAQLVATAAALALATSAAAQASRELAIVDVTVVNVISGRETPHRTVRIRGDRIVAVVPATRRLPRGARRVDGHGRWLIPGLWDMHIHSLTDGRYAWVFPLLIANGVTGIREMGSNLPLDEIGKVRRAVDRGAMLGPRIGALSPRLLDGPGSTFPTAVVVATPAEARATLRIFRAAGADFAKPYNLLSRETYLAIVDEAKKLGMPIEGHIPFSVPILEAARLGQSTTEHNFDVLVSASRDETRLRRERAAAPAQWVVNEALAATTYDRAKARRLYRQLAALGIWSCPTVAFYRVPFLIGNQPSVRDDPHLGFVPPWLVVRWSAQLAQAERSMTMPELRPILFSTRSRVVGEMNQAGVRILAGTDSGAMFAIAGFSLHDELSELVNSGLTPLEALRTATINPARFLHRARRAGSIEAGKEADVVLLDGDPLRDVRNTGRIRAVIARGRLFNREQLNALLDEARRKARASPDPGPAKPPATPASFERTSG